VELSIAVRSRLPEVRILPIMTPILAKVTALEKRGDQYQVIVQISPKYRGSFNTLAFGEIKPHSGSLKDGRLDLVYYQDPGLNIVRSGSALDSSLMEEKRRGRMSFVGLSVQPMRSVPLERHVVLCVKSSASAIDQVVD
jgi:hypothetical protein